MLIQTPLVDSSIPFFQAILTFNNSLNKNQKTRRFSPQVLLSSNIKALRVLLTVKPVEGIAHERVAPFEGQVQELLLKWLLLGQKHFP
jgi:hypothetical protein